MCESEGVCASHREQKLDWLGGDYIVYEMQTFQARTPSRINSSKTESALVLLPQSARRPLQERMLSVCEPVLRMMLLSFEP